MSRIFKKTPNNSKDLCCAFALFKFKRSRKDKLHNVDRTLVPLFAYFPAKFKTIFGRYFQRDSTFPRVVILSSVVHQASLSTKNGRGVNLLSSYISIYLIVLKLFQQLMFEGIRGSNYQGDIAIDEVSVEECKEGESARCFFLRTTSTSLFPIYWKC